MGEGARAQSPVRREIACALSPGVCWTGRPCQRKRGSVCTCKHARARACTHARTHTQKQAGQDILISSEFRLNQIRMWADGDNRGLAFVLGLLLLGRAVATDGTVHGSSGGGGGDGAGFSAGFAAYTQRWMDGAEIRTAVVSTEDGTAAKDGLYSSPHRGVFAKRNLPAGWHVARIPISAFVNIEHALVDRALGSEIRKAEHRLGYHVYEPAAVGAFLARSAAFASTSVPGSASSSSSSSTSDRYAVKFSQYAQWLARTNVDGSPAMWLDDDRADEDAKTCADDGGASESWPLPRLKDWLSGTSLLREVREWQASLQENWLEWGRGAWMRSVVSVMEETRASLPSIITPTSTSSSSSSSPSDACVHRRQFMFWAQVVQSRVHTISVRDRDGKWVSSKCMVPVADAINTGPAAKLNLRCFTNDASTHFVCKTVVPVAAGSELLTAYADGGGSLGRYLLQYGFAPPWMMHPRASSEEAGRVGGDEWTSRVAGNLSADVVWIDLNANRTVSVKISSRIDVDRLLAKWGAAAILRGVERALSELEEGRRGEVLREAEKDKRLLAACSMVRAAERAQLERVRYIVERAEL